MKTFQSNLEKQESNTINFKQIFPEIIEPFRKKTKRSVSACIKLMKVSDLQVLKSIT